MKKSVQTMIKTVEKLEQDSFSISKRDSAQRIGTIKNNALCMLANIKLRKEDTHYVSYVKVLEKLEEKLIHTISKLYKLEEGGSGAGNG